MRRVSRFEHGAQTFVANGGAEAEQIHQLRPNVCCCLPVVVKAHSLIM